MALILILDDSATNRSIYARLAAVVAEGVQVEAFGEPLDALEWLGHNRADLVITDFKMPGMDGAEFTRRLRRTPGCGTMPVLVVTAHDDRSFRVRALDAGATDFLQSPIDHFEFVTRARNLLALGLAPGARAVSPLPPESLSRILDAVPAMISATDREGRLVYANAAFAARCGARAEDMLGTPAEHLPLAGRGALGRETDLAVFRTGDAPPDHREEIAGAAGAARVLLTRKTPLRDADGAVAAVLTTTLELAPDGPAPSGGR